MKLLYRCILLALAAAGLVRPWPALAANLADKASNWRVFNTSDGLGDNFSISVTVGARGRVWVNHGEGKLISWMDGYTVGNVQRPEIGGFRIYESRSRQVWSVYPGGLLEYRDGQWINHPVREIETEAGSSFLNRIPLLPGERGHVYFLLPDRLMEFNATSNTSQTVLAARDTKMERFSDLAPARDGGAWISGARGLIKVKGPMRRAGAPVQWVDHLAPNVGSISNFQRPIENDRGGVVVMGIVEGTNRKQLALFDGEQWRMDLFPGLRILMGWPGEGDTVWAYTANALMRWEQGRLESVPRAGVLAGQYFDVAVESRGVFWLATSTGVLRFAPLPWRLPAGIPMPEMMVHAIRASDQGTLWFAGVGALVSHNQNQGQFRAFPWPDELEVSYQYPDSMFVLTNGKVLFTVRNQAFVFDPKQEKYHQARHPESRSIRLIGQGLDGRIWATTSAQGDAAKKDARLETFDGTSFLPGPITLPPGFGHDVTFLRRTRSGDWWLGGASGLAVFQDQRWHILGLADGFSSEPVFCSLELEDGQMWFGGRGTIWNYSRNRLTSMHPALDRVHQLLRARDGTLWAASGSGLHHYINGSWISHTDAEGLPSSAVHAVMVDARGELWAGTASGVARFHPEADPDPPKTRIIEPAGTREFPADEPLTIHFQGTDKWQFAAPERLLYSWRLDEGAWSRYEPLNTVVLQSPGPGLHRLELRAIDRNLNEEPTPLALSLLGVVPWYKDPRLTAIVIAAVCATLFFAGLAFNRHRRLVRSFAEVERIVDQRTRELEKANQELLHSQKMKALGTLSAGIAHDFNNILSIVRGSAQIIEANLNDRDKVLTRLQRIRTVVDQGAGIVKALLGYTRIRAIQSELYPPAAALDQALKLMGDRFLNEVRVEVHTAQGLPAVQGSQELLQQMLINLLLNAADAMAGAGVLELQLDWASPAPGRIVLPPVDTGRQLALSIKDTGMGIPPEIELRIFEPFFTTKALSTRRGTGLGLSMVYEFAKEMGYGLALKSVVGQGSTFTILLPVGAYDIPKPDRSAS